MMNPKEIELWNRFGCVGRSLLKVAGLSGNQSATEGFWEQFGHELYNDKFLAALDFLSLQPIVRTDDYTAISKAFNENNHGVLVFSQINLNPGATDELRHCSVMTEMDADEFRIWTPLQNG